MQLIDIDFKNISDPVVREALYRLTTFVQNNLMLFNSFKLFLWEFKSTVSKQRIAHKLDFVPIDVILTYKNANETITFHHEEFDSVNIVVSSTGPCKIRFIAGRFSEGALA